MQASSSAAESGDAIEPMGADADITACMTAISTEWSTILTDDARNLVNATQVLLKGNQADVRNLCKPWGVQLKEKKRNRPMDTLKQELKIALTKRAKKLKLENEASERGAATEPKKAQVAKERTVTEHASAEFCIETAMNEPCGASRLFTATLKSS